jgi:hypothetical protein
LPRELLLVRGVPHSTHRRPQKLRVPHRCAKLWAFLHQTLDSRVAAHEPLEHRRVLSQLRGEVRGHLLHRWILHHGLHHFRVHATHATHAAEAAEAGKRVSTGAGTGRTRSAGAAEEGCEGVSGGRGAGAGSRGLSAGSRSSSSGRAGISRRSGTGGRGSGGGG